MRKFEKLIIIVLVIAIIGLVYGLIPTKDSKRIKEEQKKIEEQKDYERAILTEMESIDMEKEMLKVEEAKAEKMVESINTDTEIILLTEEGSCKTTHTKDIGKGAVNKFFTHTSIEIQNDYRADYSIPTNCLHTQVIEGKVYITYDTADISVNSVEILNSVPLVDKSLFSGGYSNEELLALISNAKDYVYGELNKNEDNLKMCIDTLNEYLIAQGQQYGINEVFVNDNLLDTNVGYEFIKKPNLVQNHPNELLTSVDAIVVHSTACDDVDAERIYNNFNTCDRKASAHFVVDDKQVIQCLDTNMKAWAVGKGSEELGLYNSNTISIEICQFTDKDKQDKAITNAQTFIKEVLQKQFPQAEIMMHREISATNCPEVITDEEFEKIFKK